MHDSVALSGAILFIVRMYSDVNHPMKVCDIVKCLESYGIKVERRSVSRSLKTLCTYNIGVVYYSRTGAFYDPGFNFTVEQEPDLYKLLGIA